MIRILLYKFTQKNRSGRTSPGKKVISCVTKTELVRTKTDLGITKTDLGITKTQSGAA